MSDTVIEQDIERDGCVWSKRDHFWDCPVSMMNKCPLSILDKVVLGPAPPDCPLRKGDVIVRRKR